MKNKKDVLAETISEMKFEYREQEKRDFLLMVNNNSPEKTTKLYMAVMSKTINEAEYINKREWMDFSQDMVDGAFVEIQAKSIITLQSYLSIIKHYLTSTTPQTDDAKRGYLYTMGIDKDSLKSYINVIGEQYRYITPKEFDDIIENRKFDPISKSLFVLLYLGVKGKQFSDICSIKDKDIDLETGIIQGEDENILCEIPERYRKYFKQAMEAETYIRYDNNEKIVSKSIVNTASEYFVKRRINKNNDEFAPPDASLISNTMVDAQKSIKNPYITSMSLYLSGEAYRLIKRCGMKMPTNKDLKEFRELTGSSLSFVSMNTVCRILLDKLDETTP